MKNVCKLLPFITFIGGLFTYSLFQKQDQPQPEATAQANSRAEQSVSEKASHWADSQHTSGSVNTLSTSSAQSTLTPVTANTSPSAEELKKLTDIEQKSLWQAFSEARHKVRPIPEAWSQRDENIGYDFYALHPKQNLTTRFGDQGVKIIASNSTATEGETPTTPWSAEMSILSFAGTEITLGAQAVKAANAENRVEYQHSSELTEWYHNDTDAIEHGYTISQRPAHLAANEDIVIEVALNGLTATAHTTEDGSPQLNFTDEERTVLSYSKLLVIDAEGKELPATMAPTNTGFTIAYNDSQASYPVTVDPLIVNEEQKLNRIENTTEDQFGRSVAISGDSAIVGAPLDDDTGSNSGSAYVFTRIGSTWSEQDKLTASDAAIGDRFGESVAISGDSVIISAPLDDDAGSSSGSAYIFTRDTATDTWSQQDKLTALDAAQNDQFATSVAISGDSVVIGAPFDGSNSGSAYIFTRSGSTWSQQAKLTASDAAQSDQFGTSVAISGDSVIIGALFNSTFGSAYIFTRNGSTWSQQAKLTALDAEAFNRFGRSVAISGDSVIIGAPFDNDNGLLSGSAYIFTRDGSTWSEQAKLTALDAAQNDQFGTSVAISGDSVIVGAPLDNSPGSSSGSAYIFTRDTTTDTWSQQAQLTASDAAQNDQFGTSVAISGGSVIIGTPFNDDISINSGNAYIFTRNGSTWSEQAKLTAVNTALGDQFGTSVAISGDSVIIGAPFNSLTGPSFGSAYIFTRSGSTWSEQDKLTASDATLGDQFGHTVAISGDSVIVGAPGDDDAGSDSGSAYIFTRDTVTNNWSQQARLTASDTSQSDQFGHSVAISSDSVIIGAPDAGTAYIFTRDTATGAWLQQDKLTGSDAVVFDRFGYSVAISGDSIIVGTPFSDDVGSNSNSGSAYIFTRDTATNTWSEQAKLTASDAAEGDRFGISVAISDESVIIGAPFSDDASGSAYIFARNTATNTWSEQAKLTASDAAERDRFGISVAISDESVIIGVPFSGDNGFSSGSAYIFNRSGTNWSQQAKLTASDAAAFDGFGSSVAISGDSVIVGAPFFEDNDGPSSGSAYIFRIVVEMQINLIVSDFINVELQSGGSATPFEGQLLSTSQNYTFRITNTGENDLNLQTITLGGANASEFSLTIPDISSTADLSQNESLDLTVTFSPSGSDSNIRNALIEILSNDSNNSVFSFNISGLGLSNEIDTDGDGLNDFAEFSLRGLGFDWQTSQPSLVNELVNNASTAGLFTQSEAAAITGSAVLSDVDPITNTAVFTIELEESLDLDGFDPLTLEPEDLSVDGDGNIRLEVDAPAGKRFYRAGFAE